MEKRRLEPIRLDSYQPLREVVCETLRDAVRRGVLKPGERLMEIQLAEELGVSRTPVREAIRKLEMEGYVIMMPRRGTYIADLSIRDINEVFEIRTSLESLASGLAAERITEDELEKLQRLSCRAGGKHDALQIGIVGINNVEVERAQRLVDHEAELGVVHDEQLHPGAEMVRVESGIEQPEGPEGRAVLLRDARRGVAAAHRRLADPLCVALLDEPAHVEPSEPAHEVGVDVRDGLARKRAKLLDRRDLHRDVAGLRRCLAAARSRSAAHEFPCDGAQPGDAVLARRDRVEGRTFLGDVVAADGGRGRGRARRARAGEGLARCGELPHCQPRRQRRHGHDRAFVWQGQPVRRLLQADVVWFCRLDDLAQFCGRRAVACRELFRCERAAPPQAGGGRLEG